MLSQAIHDQVDHAMHRIDYIDFLKCIGLASIIVAHTGPPGWVIMLRCFDVPLMVIFSAMLGVRSYRRRAEAGKSLTEYYLSRVKRLVFPTWFFLIFFFLFEFLAEGTVHSFRYYAASFLLTQFGIDYVWIILVYLYSAFMIPFFFRLGKGKWIWIYVFIAYFLYELAYHLGIGTGNRLMMTTFYCFIPYGMGLTYLGCTANQMSHREHEWLAVITLIVFAGMAVYYRVTQGMLLSVQVAKYPARFYYLSYGIGCSFLLLSFCEKVHLRIYGHPWIRFISAHSLWIYLWHILVLEIYRLFHLPDNWMIKWVIVFTCSILFTFLINRAVDVMEKRQSLSWLWIFRG